MSMRFFLLLISLINVSLCCANVAVAPHDAQAAVASLERIIESSSADTQDDEEDLVGVTLEGTVKAAVSNGLAYATGYYLLHATTKRTHRKLKRVSKQLAWCTNCSLLRPLRDFEEERIEELSNERYIEHGKVMLKAFKPNYYNLKLFGTIAAQYAGATLAYGGLRAATKELTGYDAVPIVQDSTMAITAQTIGHCLAPGKKIDLFTKNQISSYVATDVTMAAGIYAYKEMTGKKLKCPRLPAALQNAYINEKNIGAFVYVVAKYALRTLVIDKLCGVPAAA